MRSLKSPTIAALLILPISSSHGAISFTVNFSAQALADLSAAEQALFNDAVNFGGGIITGYRDGESRTYTLDVNTYDEAPSGGTITLGGARPTRVQECFLLRQRTRVINNSF